MSCRACKSDDVNLLHTFGPLPIAHYYKHGPNDELEKNRLTLSLAYCRSCQLVQLVAPHDPTKHKPIFSWITQNEPETHLDRTVDSLLSQEGIKTNSVFWGISYKDKSILERIRTKGHPNIRLLDPRVDFLIEDKCANIETLQSCITPRRIQHLIDRYGSPDVVICRHVLEHSYDTRAFLKSISLFAAAGAYIAIEVPDTSKAFSRFDYTTVWEEHTLYFTPISLKNSIKNYDMQVIMQDTAEFSDEDCLTMIAKLAVDGDSDAKTQDNRVSGPCPVSKFCRSFPDKQLEVKAAFSAIRKNGSSIAVYGSGHVANTFINLFQLEPYINFVVDDDPDKIGLWMPGSKLPIVSPINLIHQNIDFCFMAVRFESTEIIKRKIPNFFEQGGVMIPICPTESNNIFSLLNSIT